MKFEIHLNMYGMLISLVDIIMLYRIKQFAYCNVCIYIVYLFCCKNLLLINVIDLIDLLCLTPLSAIFQLYHGDQF